MSGLPDWRDTVAYAAVLAGGRPALAWELLRRDPAYRADMRAVPASEAAAHFAALWGLHFPG
ncbi:transcriptional regulator domain-containing protein [Novosphingobium album (ex Liu et al. 2023)]|uniref:DUF6499 domain-containing protein n=1 Tax=Novosphingobium album (ex Liu et al. 2023) TaxID=3031130 RepID=A0ABT5WRU2_9SPHN|nr:DUF6499 domain-containing protein [Novosphingobium album (ex Liu et al. 2023)]MDE8652466.1 DUF6499 domain-containing protein [Novosphingobium album (ex Liu et al. 2023)]